MPHADRAGIIAPPLLIYADVFAVGYELLALGGHISIVRVRR